MEAVIQVSQELKPKFEELISYLDDSQQVAASSFTNRSVKKALTATC